jgi:putative transposase
VVSELDSNPRIRTLAVAVEVCGEMDFEEPLSMMMEIDTGAEINLVTYHAVPMLELHGAIVSSMSETEIGWVRGATDARFMVTSYLVMDVKIAGTEDVTTLEFLVAPEHIVLEHIVIGWPSTVAWGILPRIHDIMSIQLNLGLTPSEGNTEGNISFDDVDASTIETDDFLWTEETPILGDEGPIIGYGLSDCQRAAIAVLVMRHKRVFNSEIVKGGADVEPMRVSMRTDWDPSRLLPRRHYAPAVMAAMTQELQGQIDRGVVEECSARSGSPIHMVKKESSTSGYRFCVDYSEINKSVISTPYPLPTVQTVLDSAAQAKFFAKFDLRSGYWQFPVDPDSRDILAFQFQEKVFRYTVAAMGFVDSSFHVQRVMNDLFSRHIGLGVFVYLDDIFVYAVTFDEFYLLVEETLATLDTHNLRCKGEKCEIGMEEVTVLGHIISKDGVRMSDERIAAVQNIPFPRSARELRRFLGCVNYMRRHIPDLSTITRPLSAELNNPIAAWPMASMNEAFTRTQAAVAAQLSLAHLDYSKPIVVAADASTLGVGASISNQYIDELGELIERVVAVASHAFTGAETRWKTIEQECFALVWAVLYWRVVLWGHPFILKTDHKNLTYIHKGTSSKVVRWSLVLQSFNIALEHTPGEDQEVADALSRAPLPSPHHDLASIPVFNVRTDDYSESSSVRRYGAMRVVSEDPRRMELFLACHNSTQGHHGIHRTVAEIRALDYEWPRMTRDVTGWIAECAQCQKVRGGDADVVTVPSPIGSYCIFEELSVDFIGPLPRDEVGNSYILNAVCGTTRYCELFAVEAPTAVIAAHCLLSVVSRYGCFRRIRSDRGSHFVNEIIEEFLRLFEIQSVLTLAQRPQANALVERNGGEVMRHLRAIVLDKVIRPLWSVVLPLVMRIINRSYKPSVGCTPHRLMYLSPTDLDRGMITPFRESEPITGISTDLVKSLEASHEALLDATSEFIRVEQERVARRYEEAVVTTFEVGSMVLVKYLNRPPDKLHCRWGGPFEVVSKVGNNVVIRDLTNDARHEYDASRLKPFLVAPNVDPKAIAAADLGEVDVDVVLDHRGNARQRAQLEFLVRWTDGDETWELWEGVKKLAEVDEYIRAHPGAKLNPLLGKRSTGK